MEAGCTHAPAWWQRKGGSGHTGRALGAHSWAASVRMWLGVPQGWTLPGNIMDWHVRRATVRARRTLRAGPRFVGGRRRRLSSKRSSIVVELAAQNSIKPSFSSRSHILWPLGSRFCASRRILTSLRRRVESTEIVSSRCVKFRPDSAKGRSRELRKAEAIHHRSRSREGRRPSWSPWGCGARKG